MLGDELKQIAEEVGSPAKALDDFGEMEKLPGAATRIMKIPAPLLCYWIGQAESLQTARPREG